MAWLHIPCTESNSSPASACSAKDCEPGSTIWASRIAPFATLSGKLTPPASWLRAWKKAPWMRHLSGPTLPPSTLESGVEKWIASLPDSHAKTCLLPAGALGLTANDPVFSSRSSESPTIAVRGSCFWRTSQASLLPPPPLWTRKRASSTSARPPESWENWPTAGGTRSGSLFPRPMWVPVMAEPDGSASRGNTWLTPHGMSGMEQETGKAGAGGEFAKQATQWMTPCVPNGGRSVSAELVASKGMTESGDKRTVGLESQTRHWATPRATDGEKGGPNCRGGRGDPILAGQVCQWPTPAARDGKGTNSEEHALVTGGGRKHMDQLANFVAYSPLAQPIRDGLQSSSTTQNSRRHLNPLFGAWLMGWPSTWVIAEPHASSASATASWRSALRPHLSYFFNGQELQREAA